MTQLGGQQYAHTRHPRVLAQRGGAAVDGGSGGSGGSRGGDLLAALAALILLAALFLSLRGLPRDCISLDDTPRPRALQPQLGRLVRPGSVVSSQGKGQG